MLEIANDADLRIRAPKQIGVQNANAAGRTMVGVISGKRDIRLPEPGTLLTREFKGQTFVVKVLADGFEYEDRRYSSLSAIATEIAGSRWNGLLFFHLTGKEKRVA